MVLDQVGAGGESSHEQRTTAAEEEEQQLLYRMPVFDPAFSKFCSLPTPPVDNCYTVQVSMTLSGYCREDAMGNDNTFMVVQALHLGVPAAGPRLRAEVLAGAGDSVGAGQRSS